MHKTLGIILTALGLLVFVWSEFTYTTREKVFDTESIHGTIDKRYDAPLPQILGVAAVIGGIVLLVVARRKLGASPKS